MPNLSRVSLILTNWLPLAMMPFVTLLRSEDLLEANEWPKWMAFLSFAVLFTLAALLLNAPTKGNEKRHRTLSISLPALLFFTLFLFFGEGILQCENLWEATNRFAFWCAGGILFIASALAIHSNTHFVKGLQMTLCITSLVLCLHFWYGFFFIFVEPGFNKLVNFSLIGHFNFTSDTLTVLIPLLVWTATSNAHRIVKMIAVFCLASTLFMLISGGGLGAIGGLTIGTLVAVGVKVISGQGALLTPRPFRPSWKSALRSLGFVVILAALLTLAFERLPDQFKDHLFERAVWWTPATLNQTNGTETLPPLAGFWASIGPYLGARTPMWASTLGMIMEHPLSGYGTGSYAIEYPAFSKRYDFFNDDEIQGLQIRTNPHNIMLQIAAENGIPMALLFVGLYGWLTLKVTQRALRQPDNFWLTGVCALWAAGLDALVNQMFYNPSSLYMISLLGGCLYGQLESPPTILELKKPRLLQSPLSFLIVALSSIGIAAIPIRAFISQYEVAKASRLSLEATVWAQKAMSKALSNALIWFPANPEALFSLANLEIIQGDLSSGENHIKEFLRFYPHHLTARVTLSEIQIKQGRLRDAEATLTKAADTEPKNPVILKKQRHLQSLIESPPPAQ